MKALEILKDCSKEGFLRYTRYELDEAIAELKELTKLKTCDECKHDYLIDNFDSVDGKRLDSFSPNECYICSRNFNDKYEPKA